ncbi:phosphoglycerate mutase [Actinokineospora fastidiosa]|uniref:Phosphoglycerate mutase n=2 Tax=Actinokineospora fastidiosa TaxID=1816 RepID=A0A918GAR2_9PSEU|nr:phosphoglycerate mutase [Actinokineospora fastidiosa]
MEYRQARFVVPPGATEMILVRHGESAPAVPGVPFDLVDGQGDPALAPDGLAQAECVASRLVDAGIDAVYVTPLRRTAETAAPLLGKLGLTARVEPDLREVHLGEWEGGLFRIKVAAGHPLTLRMVAEQRWDVIPGAEPDDAFAARVRAGISRIHADNPGRRVAVFTHSGVIGCVLSLATGSSRLAFSRSDNGSITRVVVDGAMWHVRSFNDTAHLTADLVGG